MKRREFITLIGGAAAWPLAASAQQAGSVRRIGILVNGAKADQEMQVRIAAFQQELGQLGWSEGHNVRIDPRFSGAEPERLPQLAKEDPIGSGIVPSLARPGGNITGFML